MVEEADPEAIVSAGTPHTQDVPADTELNLPRRATQETPSFSAAIVAPLTRLAIFWKATSRA